MTSASKKILHSIINLDPERRVALTEETRIVDLALDSIDYVEIALKLTSEFGISADQLPDLETATIGDLYRCIDRAVNDTTQPRSELQGF